MRSRPEPKGRPSSGRRPRDSSSCWVTTTATEPPFHRPARRTVLSGCVCAARGARARFTVLQRKRLVRLECRGLVFDTDGRLLCRRLHKFINVDQQPEASGAVPPLLAAHTLTLAQPQWWPPRWRRSRMFVWRSLMVPCSVPWFSTGAVRRGWLRGGWWTLTLRSAVGVEERAHRAVAARGAPAGPAAAAPALARTGGGVGCTRTQCIV